MNHDVIDCKECGITFCLLCNNGKCSNGHEATKEKKLKPMGSFEDAFKKAFDNAMKRENAI